MGPSSIRQSIATVSRPKLVVWSAAWSGIDPEDFVVPTEFAFITEGHRVMSAREAAVLGLSSDGGVVQRIYLLAPDGNATYAFSLWPMLPDETG